MTTCPISAASAMLSASVGLRKVTSTSHPAFMASPIWVIILPCCGVHSACGFAYPYPFSARLNRRRLTQVALKMDTTRPGEPVELFGCFNINQPPASRVNFPPHTRRAPWFAPNVNNDMRCIVHPRNTTTAKGIFSVGSRALKHPTHPVLDRLAHPIAPRTGTHNGVNGHCGVYAFRLANRGK